MARIRITIDCNDDFKRAFLARASVEGVSPQELFERLVTENFPDELASARRFNTEGEPEPANGAKGRPKPAR